jgi:N-hydroxyarylamine O-acetyltransferase
VNLDPDHRDAYLRRLGVVVNGPPDADLLRALQAAHLRSVPFENLDIHLGVPIVLEPTRLVAKLTDRHRGGFCYELNGALAMLLEDLGFSVRRMEARVYGRGGEVSIPFDHLCLRVDLDDPWLVDIGFGACFDEPLRLVPDVGQTDPTGSFRIGQRDDGWLDLVENGVAQYRFSPEPRALADFADACVHHQTSPESHFTQNPVCTLRTGTGRVTLRGTSLIVTEDGRRHESELTDLDELRRTYREAFGIQLTRDEITRLAG